MKIRLDKAISDSGKYSRKEAKTAIKNGRVLVNGEVAISPEQKVFAETDVISVDNEVLRTEKYRYFIMDKPKGYICAAHDTKHKTVLDLLPRELVKIGVLPVGRLDKETSGMLLLTNDGDFAHKVISPKSNIEKCYIADTDIKVTQSDIDAFEAGVLLKDGTICKPAGLKILDNNKCEVTVTEGKYHQVRRMLAARGKKVIELRRIRIGICNLDQTICCGGFREMTEAEIAKILGKLNNN